MSYYKYAQALENLRSKLDAYSVSKELALARVYECSDVSKATLLLKEFLSQYESDPSIYSKVNDIALRLNDTRVLSKSAPKSLRHNRLDAQCHFAFGVLLNSSDNPLDTFLEYLLCTKEYTLHRTIVQCRSNLDNALNIVLQYFTRATVINSRPYTHIRLGNFFLLLGELDNAETEFRTTLKLRPDCAVAHTSLALVHRLSRRTLDSYIAFGYSHFHHGEYNLAIENFSLALSQKSPTKNVEVEERLAESYLRSCRYSEAVDTCRYALKRKRTITLYTILIHSLKAINEVDEVLKVADSAGHHFPNELFFKFPARMILPIIYNSISDIKKHRTRFTRTLNAWKTECVSNSIHLSSAKLCDSIQTTNFFLGYQGRRNLKYQKAYGTVLQMAMNSKYPNLSCQPSRNFIAQKRRIRVGYISAFCNWHTVGKLFLGWIRYHNLEQFEIYVYHLGSKMDFLSASFKEASSHFRHLHVEDIDKIATRILTDDLDIMVHLEFGMDVLLSKIAALRLAPIQCLTWGHPISSGLSTIDYFISNEAMEPSDGDHHYSETLIRLPNIGVCVPRPTTASKRTKADYGLSDESTIFVSPHSFFKHLPQYDHVFVDIARLSGKAKFVFIERDTVSNKVTSAFKRRIDRKFRQSKLNPNDHIYFLPQQSSENFLGLLTISDIYLDSIGWSGGMTTLEALGCMLPIVTTPGAFMRGRHSYGCLKQLGVLETVAHDVGDYVGLSVRLARDEDWRQEIISRQEKNFHKLYDDKECILALEKFYQSVAFK